MSIGFLNPRSDEPRSPPIKGDIAYFKGDLAEYTGNKKEVYGALFYEVVLLEGHLIGETKLVVYKG